MWAMRSVVALLFLILTGRAAAALEGRVVLRNGSTAVADAEVSIIGRPGSVRTDGAGKFTWTPTPTPPFDVLVMLPGGHFVQIGRASCRERV